MEFAGRTTFVIVTMMSSISTGVPAGMGLSLVLPGGGVVGVAVGSGVLVGAGVFVEGNLLTLFRVQMVLPWMFAP